MKVIYASDKNLIETFLAKKREAETQGRSIESFILEPIEMQRLFAEARNAGLPAMVNTWDCWGCIGNNQRCHGNECLGIPVRCSRTL